MYFIKLNVEDKLINVNSFKVGGYISISAHGGTHSQNVAGTFLCYYAYFYVNRLFKIIQIKPTKITFAILQFCGV